MTIPCETFLYTVHQISDMPHWSDKFELFFQELGMLYARRKNYHFKSYISRYNVGISKDLRQFQLWYWMCQILLPLFF